MANKLCVPPDRRFMFSADTKNCSGILPNSTEEVAHNAVTIMWKPMEEKAKVIPLKFLAR